MLIGIIEYDIIVVTQPTTNDIIVATPLTTNDIIVATQPITNNITQIQKNMGRVMSKIIFMAFTINSMTNATNDITTRPIRSIMTISHTPTITISILYIRHIYAFASKIDYET